MSTTENSPRCLACGKDAEQLPLVTLQFRGQTLYICPQDMPALIHAPQKLVGKLPGAEGMRAADLDA